MIKKTGDYGIFSFRDDNREKIDQGHVKRLAESIKSRNLLELRPIVVNEKMELIDGQHRLLAAKLLGVEIYYQQEVSIEPSDIILMNISKSWGMSDYLNFHCQHENSEYKKLRTFMNKHSLNIQVALNIAIGKSQVKYHDFRVGKFKFDLENLDVELEVCWESIAYIKKMNGFSPYTKSSRFWQALLKLTRHHEFDANKWKSNMQKMIDKFSSKASTKDYLRMMQSIYNWRNPSKINISEDE